MSCSIGKKCNKKTWLEDFCVLFDNSDILPTKTMSKNEKVNSITRLILLIFSGMVIFKYPYALNFLCLSIIIILILYFLTTKEHYNNMDTPRVYKYPLIEQNKQAMKKLSVQPIIVPRAHDRDVWSFPSYRHSAINYNAAGYDISEEYSSVPQDENYKEFDPRMESYTNFNLDSLGDLRKGAYPSSSPNLARPSAGAGTLNNSKPSYLDQGHYSGIPKSTESQYTPDGMTQIDNTHPREGFTSLPPRHHGRQFQQRQPQTNISQIRPASQYKESFVTPIQNVLSKSPQNFSHQNFSDYSNMKSGDSDLPYLPPQDLLIPRTITSIYGEGDVSNEERIKYLENIEPTQYSYSDVAYPINANLGISYTPDIPPMVLDQVATPYGTYPLFHRIDPQLIRSQGIPDERKEELPFRSAWSARYSGFDAAPGSVNFEDIYDPKFTGYGDENRSYGDVNLGQVNYYYSDVDAYRSPNFGIRTKVDHIDFVDPMGKILPEYARNVGVNDIKESIHDQYNSDALYFREGLQERLMKKRNRELWQLRAMPLSKGANVGTFSSNY